MPRIHRPVDPRTFTVLDGVDWINVIAVTKDQQIVLVKQFRHGIEALTLEIPGGAVDPGEAHQSAAVRELREETGYTSERWEHIGTVHPTRLCRTTCARRGWRAIRSTRAPSS